MIFNFNLFLQKQAFKFFQIFLKKVRYFGGCFRKSGHREIFSLCPLFSFATTLASWLMQQNISFKLMLFQTIHHGFFSPFRNG
jgi:hypothetical protein